MSGYLSNPIGPARSARCAGWRWRRATDGVRTGGYFRILSVRFASAVAHGAAIEKKVAGKGGGVGTIDDRKITSDQDRICSEIGNPVHNQKRESEQQRMTTRLTVNSASCCGRDDGRWRSRFLVCLEVSRWSSSSSSPPQ